ncbi:hypothetical protein NP493_1156g01017 [Ridgeia piscesae]|uniref:Alkylated DNA repair protein alkB homolog 8 n=1 Tax=Ridgeia piscesae TaxID=27915 RepID=A0AAD9KFH2_RIDPI|nr:hypothetical protein NP493_1156g01017 [Ridgeia piscesae]
MAAPSLHVSGAKMSKSDRRLLRKHNKFKINFARRKDVHISDIPTQHLLVNNGGLGNNVQREQLLSVFEPFGRVTSLVMEQDQPYAFVSYSSIPEALAACTAIHGCLVKALQTVPSAQDVQLFLTYVDRVPDVAMPSSGLPEGLVMIRDFVSEDEEQVFLQCVDWDSSDSQLSEGAHLTLKHRRVKHYGYEFMYGINNVDPDRPLEQGIPHECDQFLDRLMALGCLNQRPDQLTVNQYKPGQGIPVHVDTHSAFEDGIVVLSLGSQAIMDFKGPKGEHFPVMLPRRSLAVMLGPSRYQFTHGIMPRKSDVMPVQSASGDSLTLSRRDTRTSFTFRILRRGPCHCCYREQCDSQTPHGSQVCTRRLQGHFSDTRHSPWPRVVEFLKQLPLGALVADVGCGNGKYLSINPGIHMVRVLELSWLKS